nr:NADH-quinone oxidoreductase subunit NuoE [Blochmannia endosymbiont of Camponotus (Colobopsis) obliquus]
MKHMKIQKSFLSKEELCAIQREISHCENTRAAAIEALKIVQRKRGWISDNIIGSIAQALNVTQCDLEEIATFYNQIFRKPVGQHIIRFCDSVVCYIMGYHKIKMILEKILKINIGETSDDGKFTLLPTCCLGKCDQSPVMMIDDETYVKLTPESIFYILEKYQ